MDRQIVCFQIPSFGIALARRTDTSLRTRPVAIAPAHSPRARLLEASREAVGDGVVPGISLDLARRLCPALRVLPPDSHRTRAVHRELQQLVAGFAPLWEPVRPGHFYLDLTGTTRLYGRVVDAAARLEREINARQELTGVIGIAGSKLVSHLAAIALGQPSQLVSILPGAEQTFLEPLPIDLVPGLTRTHGPAIRITLDDLNLHTWGAIAATPMRHLELAVGSAAHLLHEWSLGIDPTPVRAAIEQPSLERTRRLDPDVIDDDVVLGHAYDLLEQLCRGLRQQQRVCRRLVLTLRQSDHIERSAHRTLETGTYWEHDLAGVLKTLFFAACRRRVRLQRIALRAEALEPPSEQLALFAPDPSPEQTAALRRQRVSLAVDRVRERFGDAAVRWGYAALRPPARPL